jgi:hypothetical protein
MNRRFLHSKLGMALALLAFIPGALGQTAERWWPVQKMPRSVVRTASMQDFPKPRLAFQMLAQSAAGLAAQAVNENRSDEMVWVYNGDGDLEKWFSRWLAANTNVTVSGTFKPWDLVDRCAKRGIIKGYILYRSGDDTVNIATSLAGLLDGVIVDETLEPGARAHGLKRLLDVRDKTPLWCFQTYRDQFNRHMLFLQDPKKPHNRDLAIAQKVLTLYGHDEPIASAVARLDPVGLILGWNEGDEFENTDLFTRFGDIQTGTDWCLNLPVLMSGTENWPLRKIPRFNPHTINWKDTRSGVSFISTDGDNVQWLEGNFFRHKSYWGNRRRGKIPFGWSCCFAHLTQLFPEAIDYARLTQTTNDSFIEWSGGYYYPDHFASARTNRWELLAQHARQTWALMKQTGLDSVGLIFDKVDSPDALKACQVFAGQTDGLLAIFAFQYAPYEGGAGKVFWVTDSKGIDVPVITDRYSIWDHSNDQPRSGTPAKIAREIRQTVAGLPDSQPPRFDWVTVHVWSYFRHAPGTDEDAENMPQENAEAAGGVRGYLPAVWCTERLPSSIRVISPEELAWRVRMQHNPSQTRQLIDDSF